MSNLFSYHTFVHVYKNEHSMVIVHFVDMSEIVDHYCLNFLLKLYIVMTSQMWFYDTFDNFFMYWCHSWWSLCVIRAGFLYIYVLLLEIQLSRVEGWDPINWFDPATFLCLSQTLTWVSIITCHVLFVSGDFSQNERWLLVLLLLVELMTIAG